MNFDVNTALLVLVALVLLFAGGLIVTAFRQALNTLPQWASEAIRQNHETLLVFSDRFTEALKEEAAKTPNTLDDRLAAYIDEKVAQLLSESVKAQTVEPQTKADLGVVGHG